MSKLNPSAAAWRAALFLSASVLSAGAAAAQVPAEANRKIAETATNAEAGLGFDEIIVTGVGAGARKFEQSFAVTTLSSDALQKLAPINFADLLNQVPGIFAEASGGEVQNVYRVRGIPNEGNFQAFHENGMPTYQDNDGPFFKGDVMNRVDLMTANVEFVRGGPAPIFASNAAAIYNQVLRRGTEKPEGAVQTTIGDTGLYRLDGYWAGPIGGDYRLAAGGFIRTHEEGYRPGGFPTDRGGQFRATLSRDFGATKLTGYFKLLDDNNVFFLPTPLFDAASGRDFGDLVDFFEGTLNSPALQNTVMRFPSLDGASVVTEKRDLSDGRSIKLLNGGFDVEHSFANGWAFTNKLRYTQGELDFDALYSTSAPQLATNYANAFLTGARTAFGADSTLRYTLAGTDTVFDPATTGGFVIQAQYRAIATDFRSFMNDTRLTRTIDFLGKHDFTVGVYHASHGTDYRQRYQDMLFELRSQPRLLDIQALSPTGVVRGRVTDNGVVRYNTSFVNADAETTLWALYLNDQWQVTPKFRIDAGVRHEDYDMGGDRSALRAGALPVNDPTTLADNFSSTNVPTGAKLRDTIKESVTAWTIGANYDFSRNVGVYGRASTAFRVPTEFNIYLDALPITTEARQFEAGLKLNVPTLSAFVTAFWTSFEPLNAGFLDFSAGGAPVNRAVIGEVVTPGVELDFAWTPNTLFSLDGAVTYNEPELTGFRNFNAATGQPGTAVPSAEGKLPVRQPELYGSIRPALTFTTGEIAWDVYARYNFVGGRFVDLSNATALPAYETWAAGVSADIGRIRLQLVGENLLEEEGVTEGNPRADVIGGQGSRVVNYGRTLFGRNFRLTAAYRW
jgi:outer membrane receptor protein involved in Fe transport